MFRKAEALHPVKHNALRIAPTESFEFAHQTLTVPIVFSEMADVAREYPLLFQKNTDMPVALMGAETGVNAYVAPDGRWRASYIPARIATYPFVLVPIPDKPAEMALVVDMAAEQISRTIGFALFEINGQQSVALKKRMHVLKKMKEQEATTARMVRQIRDAGLLVERAIRVSAQDSEDRQITGLEFVNEKALNEMPHADFAKLRDSGVFPMIYSHLLSMSNLRHGIIARAYRASPVAAESQVDLDGFFRRNADDLRVPGPGDAEASVIDLSFDDGDIDLTRLSRN